MDSRKYVLFHFHQRAILDDFLQSAFNFQNVNFGGGVGLDAIFVSVQETGNFNDATFATLPE